MAGKTPPRVSGESADMTGGEPGQGGGPTPKQSRRPSASIVGPITPPGRTKLRSPSLSSLLSCPDEGGFDTPVAPTRNLKVPDVAIPMQHALLKRISAFQSKEELLDFVAHYHCLLDLINLVTCLYRLAKMSKEASRGRNSYLAELQRHPTFQLLLRSISSKFLQGHLNYLHSHNEGLKGVDGRCLANLTWALAKLDLSADDSALTTELALTVAPFIIRTIDSSSPQGLATTLWSYAKLPVAPPAVVTALVSKITDQLVAQAMRADGRITFDAQALSNSIWALAHLKSRGMDVDCGAVMARFMAELARAAGRCLLGPHASLAPPGRSGGELRLPECQRYLALVEREFSCQALVNIAWSFATLLGPAAPATPAVQQLFLLIHDESITRLRCTAVVLGSGQPLPYVGGGGFNEQALSNAVYAFDKVGLVSRELLGAVFEVSALRLRRGSMAHHPDLTTFKPQELCTLLKACHSHINIAPPWVFLSSLLRLLGAHPHMADSWTAAERCELQRACQLFAAHQAEAAQAVAAAGRQGLPATDFGQAVSAAQGLANSIANSISAAAASSSNAQGGLYGPSGPPSNGTSGVFGASGPPSVGRLSGLGMSPPSLSMMGDARPSAGAVFGRPRSSSGASGSPYSGAGGGAGGGGAATAAAAAQRAQQHGAFGSTFGQLPASAAMAVAAAAAPSDLQVYEALLRAQQQQQQQQNLAALLQQQQGGFGGQPQLLSCPVCSIPLRQHEAVAHVEACLASRDASASLELLIRQQQQQQDAAALWAAQQQQAQAQAAVNQQNLVLARLQQLQQQQGLLAVAQRQQEQQQQLQLQAAGLAGLEAAMKGGGDAGALAPWMLDGAAGRPPLRPMRRV